MALLARYWFTFSKSARPTLLSLGCGITAYDLTDAHRMLREKVFPMTGEQAIEGVIECIDVSTLEEKHVRPNMGNPIVRGVWFPMLYGYQTQSGWNASWIRAGAEQPYGH